MKLSKAHPQVKELLANTYPDYTGRKVELRESDTYYMQDYWDGGTRYYVKAVKLTDLSAVVPYSLAQNPFNKQAHTRFPIPDGIAMVEHIFFCGKDVGIRINVNKNTFPKLLAEAIMPNFYTEFGTDIDLKDRAKAVGGNYNRADGRTVCEKCQKPYSEHPVNPHYTWLTRLCNGDLVKL